MELRTDATRVFTSTVRGNRSGPTTTTSPHAPVGPRPRTTDEPSRRRVVHADDDPVPRTLPTVRVYPGLTHIPSTVIVGTVLTV